MLRTRHATRRTGRRWCIALSAMAAMAASCGGDKDADSTETPTSQTADSAELWFEEVAAEVGVDFRHQFGPVRLWMPEVAGSGVGLFDIDGDGDLDMYALQGCDLDPSADSEPADYRNRLYENQGDGTFVDITDSAGIGDTGFGVGCAVGDYDGDGKLDLYVTNVGDNVLYRNLGGGRFEDVTASAGVTCPHWSSSASFVDYDLDGHDDLFVVNYLRWSPEEELHCDDARGEPTYCGPNRYQGPETDRLYRNRGDGTFEDVTLEKGLDKAFGNGLGLVWGQLDDRPGIDFYVANDGLPNQLWSGTQNGPMAERAMALGCALSANGVAEAGMGVCMEDMDRDGKWDVMVTHLSGETNTFYMSSKRGFRDKTAKSGTMSASLSRTGFGVGMADFDHDGYLDMYVANGRVTFPSTPLDPNNRLAEYDQIFVGAPKGRFKDLPLEQIAKSPALSVGRGAAFGDIDNDGDVDVVINDYRGPLRILRNVTPKKGAAATWTVLETNGLDAIGAEIRFKLDGTNIQRQVQRTYSLYTSNDPRVHVGLGDVKTLDQVEVTWLDGTREIFGPLSAGERATLRRGEGRTQ